MQLPSRYRNIEKNKSLHFSSTKHDVGGLHMKVNNTSIFMGNDTLCARYEKQQNNNGKTSKKSIDGSSFQAGIDPIAAKKEEARKKAMRIGGNAFENELKIDDDLSARREKIKTLQEEKGEANRAIREIEDNRAALREVYGVDEDSQEEKELKLLEKEASEKMPGSKVSLSLDERKAIKEIKERGLSEYQQRSLDMFESETGYRNTVYEADQKIKTENQIITATNAARDTFNDFIRHDLYNRGKRPVLSDKVMCRQNNWDCQVAGIYLTNGLIGYITDIDRSRSHNGYWIISFQPTFMEREFEGLQLDLKYITSNAAERKNFGFIKNEKFEYAYAVTCHAMQGSSDNRVLYADQRMRDPYYTKKLRYTAITRARESITIVLGDEHSDY